MSALVELADGALVALRGVGVVLLHGTALAALAWLLSATVLRRARPAVIAALWTVVLLKFAVPVGPALPWSLSDLLSALLDGGRGARIGVLVVQPAHAVAPVASWPGWPALAALLASALWLMAVAAIAVRRVRAQREAVSRARALPAASAAVRAQARAVAARLGLPCEPDLRVDGRDDRIGGRASSPWVAGLRAPIVVVPSALAARPVELAAALAHELAHLRRRDAWLRVVQVAIGAVFFFWPVVRWVNRRIDAAREMACDAYAVAHGPLSARDYARLLVRLARGPAPEGSLALTAPRLLRGRVDALLASVSGRRSGPGIGKVGAVGLAAWAAIALGGASRARAEAPHGEVCIYTDALASSLLAAHPEADRDGDGVLTRAEACELQAELRRRMAPGDVGEAAISEAAVSGTASGLVSESLCCNCGDGEGTSSPPTGFTFRANQPANTCVRGVDP